MSNGVREDQFKKYQNDLGELIDVFKKLIGYGKAYEVVILAHDLARYTYGAEPTVGLMHTDPVPFMAGVMDDVLARAKLAAERADGYGRPDLASNEEASSVLEKRTSDFYTTLWEKFDRNTLISESRALIEARIPADDIDSNIKGARVLDMGCGSGRFTVALAALGARHVTGLDFQAKSSAASSRFCRETNLPVEFVEGDVLETGFDDGAFDFVFCNGVLHHTRDWRAALAEYSRVMGKAGFIYLYARGGIFWETRRALREAMKIIPPAYCDRVLGMIGLPSNRFFLMDTWYVPVEEHLARTELETLFKQYGLSFRKVISKQDFDLDRALAAGIPGAELAWGEGEHRYIVGK